MEARVFLARPFAFGAPNWRPFAHGPPSRHAANGRVEAPVNDSVEGMERPFEPMQIAAGLKKESTRPARLGV